MTPLEELFQWRQLVDYGGDEDFPLSEVEASIEIAENFLTYVKTTYA